jgi:uncharacterized membrane protein HdeD (DUF308 family)
VHSAANWSIALSVLMIIAGILAIFLPMAAGLAVTVLIAWLLIISGILHLIYGWRAGSAGGVVVEILLGLLYLAIGIYLLSRPLVGLAALTLALGVYLFIEAILEFVMAYRTRGLQGSGWLVFDGIITLILAIIIWSAWPAGTPWVIGTLVGVSMFFSGISRLAISMAVRRATA